MLFFCTSKISAKGGPKGKGGIPSKPKKKGGNIIETWTDGRINIILLNTGCATRKERLVTRKKNAEICTKAVGKVVLRWNMRQKNNEFIKDVENVHCSGLYRAVHKIANFGIPSTTYYKKKNVLWGHFEGPISSGYLAHCLQPFFMSIRTEFSVSYAIAESCDTDFASQVIYKPWVLSVSSKALVPDTAVWLPATNCVLLLHQLVIEPVTIHLM